jgi:hypothetical protein
MKGRLKSDHAVEASQRTEIEAGFIFNDLYGGLDAVIDQFLRRIRLSPSRLTR